MKKIVFTYAVISIVALVSFFLLWGVSGNLGLAGAVAVIGSTAASIFATLSFSKPGEKTIEVDLNGTPVKLPDPNNYGFHRFRRAAGIWFFQMAVVNGVVSYTQHGRFWMAVGFVPRVLLGVVFLWPFLGMVAERQRLIKEESNLRKMLLDLEKFSYRSFPPDFADLENRLVAVRARLAYLDKINI